MEPRIITSNEFIQRYWKYYLILEENFLNTEQYLAIDELNFNSFSNEYLKQYQTICSEIDVITKSYCRELNSSFRGNTINKYCKCVTDNNSDFVSREIKMKNMEIKLCPWKDWTYITENNKIISNNPDWWQKYNKVKHNRTTVNSETGLPYYKFANQKNVLNSLAALFQLELYYFKKLHLANFPVEADMLRQSSKLFEIENWGDSWLDMNNIGFQIIEEVEE